MRATLLLAALLLAGCVAEAPRADPPAAAPPSPAQTPPDETAVTFEGTFSGVSAARESFTRQSEGIHRFEVPPGNPAVVMRVTWSGTSPHGIQASLGRGDGTHVGRETFTAREVEVTLPPGKLPSGEANLMMGPADNGASVQVAYKVTLRFAAVG